MVSSTSKGNAPNAGKCTVITLKCTFHCRGCCRGIRPESVVESWGRLALGSCPMCFFWPKLPSPANFPGNIRRGGRGGRGDRREIGGREAGERKAVDANGAAGGEVGRWARSDAGDGEGQGPGGQCQGETRKWSDRRGSGLFLGWTASIPPLVHRRGKGDQKATRVFLFLRIIFPVS